jgi:hypothetical protein
MDERREYSALFGALWGYISLVTRVKKVEAMTL